MAAYRLMYKTWWRNGCVERKKTQMAKVRWISSENLIRLPRSDFASTKRSGGPPLFVRRRRHTLPGLSIDDTVF